MEESVLSTFTDREQELFNTLTDVCNANLINVRVNCFGAGINYPISLDVEHDEQGNMVCIGVYDGQTHEAHIWTEVNDFVKETIEKAEIIAHNGKTDFECLRQWGIDVRDEQLIWDTELIAHIIDSSRKGYGLKKLAFADLGISYPSYEDIVGKRTAKLRRTLEKWPIRIVALYNGLDAFVTYKLYEQQKRTLSGTGLAYFNELEKPVSYVFQSLENRGIRVDLGYLRKLKSELELQQAPIEASIKNELGPINLNSPKQLLEALNAKEIYPELKGKPSTDKRALAAFKGNSIIQQLLAFSELETLLSSFVYPYLERNVEVVRPFFNQCGTRTGRPSCSNPNLLQIPKKTDNGKLVRRMFIPREGMSMGDCDYGQIEPRVMAHFSKDPDLCGLFNRGENFHEYTRLRLDFPDTDEGYNKAKVLNLSVGYRATFKSVQSQLGGTREEAQEQIDAWWSLFPQLRRWQDKLIYDSKRSGFCTTLLGRRIRVDGLSEGNSWKRESAERQLVNNIAQGSAAEIMKMAMINIYETMPGIGILVQVYDELVFEAPNIYIKDVAEEVVWNMETAVKLDVPLTVDCKTGASWADCH
jgi:DNA polymerase I